MPLELIVVTPEGQAFHGEVESVVLPGSEGDFGLLPGHEPFMTGLRIGGMSVRSGAGERHAALSQGFAEIHEDTVTVMVGTCEYAEDIDLERAQVARDRAQKQLAEMRQTEEGEAAYQEYQDAYSRAIARISVTDKFKH